MGAAASMVSEPNDEFDSTGGRKSTSVKSAGRSVNSVRAMALMNHSRQENSYISQDGLKANLKNSLRVVDGKDGGRKRNTKVKVSAAKAAERPEEQKMPHVANGGNASSGGMNMFRSSMGLNLKITVQDESDWVQVRDFSCFPSVQ